MAASPSTVITLGYGTWGGVNLLPTIGYGIAQVIPLAGFIAAARDMGFVAEERNMGYTSEARNMGWLAKDRDMGWTANDRPMGWTSPDRKDIE